MFNPKRAAQYLAHLLAPLLPLFGVILALSLTAQYLYRRADFPQLVTSWRFWLIVLGSIGPGILAVLGTYLLAVYFVRDLYGLDNTTEAQQVVRRLLFGQSSFGPWLKVAGGIAEGAEQHVLTRVGGPGNLVVYNDSAVLLEKSGRLTRVADKGFCQLEKFERIYWVVDLRPKRSVYPVSAMSKEGIPITCEAEINYQIDSPGLTPTEQVPFPVSEDKVFRAATCTWIREADRPTGSQIMDWSGRVIISETEGNLRTILARYPLDRLIGLASVGNENPREEIREELETRLKAAVPKLGARILEVALGDIEVEDEVTRQWVDAWKAEWARWAAEQEGRGKAEQAEQIENAKTRAQVMLLTTITEAFEPKVLQQQNVTARFILARLFMVLSRAPSDPLTRVSLPREAINTLKLLKDLL
jgi:regulator of protease activity HflC (stomatin/prohibitin superfamily)